MIEQIEVYKNNGERIYYGAIKKRNQIKDPVTLKMDVSEEMIKDIITWANEQDKNLFDVIHSLICSKWRRIKNQQFDCK